MDTYWAFPLASLPTKTRVRHMPDGSFFAVTIKITPVPSKMVAKTQGQVL
jgi:hypothetical protein